MITAKKIFIVFLLFFFFAIPALPEEIHDAARQGDLAKIKRLLEKNPGLLEARNQNEKTPLHFAAQGGHKEIVEFLIGKGADINAKNIAKETPLHYAAAMGHKEVVDLLLAKGAVLNSGTSNGSTPLHYSANLGNPEIIRLLIEKGVDVNGRNKYGNTSLDLAYDFDQKEAAQLIVSKGGLSSPVDDPEVVRLSGSVNSVLFHNGNQTNLGVFVGNDGILLVDTGFSRRAETKLKAAISRLGSGKIKYIINTHLHQDHVACNSIGGESAIVINHSNLEKMASEGIIARAEGSIEGKTGKTFKNHYTMTFNGEEIKLIPYPGVHSDADLIIYFAGSGVVHMGDLLLSESFPSVGGNAVEYMELLKKIIDIFPADTLFINGHGKNCTLEDIVNYQRMLLSSIEIVRNHMKAGKSIKEMRREKVLKDYEKWDSFIYFLDTDYWIGAVYNSYKDKQEESFSSEPNYITFSRIDKAWEYTKGENSKVAILDWLFDMSPEASKKYENPTSLVPDEPIGTGEPWHGEWMAEIVHQIAPEAKIIPVRARPSRKEEDKSESDRQPYEKYLIEGIRFAADQGAVAITNSMGPVKHCQELKTAVDYAERKRTVFINVHPEYLVFTKEKYEECAPDEIDKSDLLQACGQPHNTHSCSNMSYIVLFTDNAR